MCCHNMSVTDFFRDEMQKVVIKSDKITVVTKIFVDIFCHKILSLMVVSRH